MGFDLVKGPTGARSVGELSLLGNVFDLVKGSAWCGSVGERFLLGVRNREGKGVNPPSPSTENEPAMVR